MPHNNGSPPPHELVDLRFRCGSVRRREDPKRWRWSIGDSRFPPDWAYDIVEWQAA
jgi:hypothetical protein